MNRVIILLIFSALVVGCASKKPAALPPISDTSFFGVLEKDSDEWKLTRISHSNPIPYGGVTVDLSTKLPSRGANTSEVTCSFIMWAPKYDDSKDSCIKGPFRSTAMRAMTIPTYIVVGAFTMGMGWVMGSTNIDSYFDWDEYYEALNSALAENNLSDENLKTISEKIKTIDRVQNKASKLCRDIESNQKKYEKLYYEKYLDEIRKLVKVIDLSGFSNSYDHIDGKSQLGIKTYVASSDNYLKNCGTQKIAVDSADYATVMSTLNEIENSLKQRLDLVYQDKSAYEQKLKDGGYFEVSCMGKAGAKNRNFKYRSYCPEKIAFTGSELKTKPELKFELESRDFMNVMPNSYELSDANIRVSLQGNVIKITNLTDKYISLNKLSIYHDESIVTKGSNSSTFIDLPPNSYETYSLSRFDMGSFSNDYTNLTMSKAKKITVLFGISSKYSVTNSSVKHTLHGPKSYSLTSIL